MSKILFSWGGMRMKDATMVTVTGACNALFELLL